MYYVITHYTGIMHYTILQYSLVNNRIVSYRILQYILLRHMIIARLRRLRDVRDVLVGHDSHGEENKVEDDEGESQALGRMPLPLL